MFGDYTFRTTNISQGSISDLCMIKVLQTIQATNHLIVVIIYSTIHPTYAPDRLIYLLYYIDDFISIYDANVCVPP